MISIKNNRPSWAGWKITFNCLSLTENLYRNVQSLLYAYDIVIICVNEKLCSRLYSSARLRIVPRLIKALSFWSGLSCR